MTEINDALLRKVLEHIDAHPEAHDQEIYLDRTPCGTTGCVAGHTVLMSGHEVDWTRHLDAVVVTGESIHNVAQVELGLTPGKADELFDPDNTVDDLWSLADWFTHGEITRPPR